MNIDDLYYQEKRAKNPKGSILVLHGYPEHSARHQKTIDFLQAHDWNVFTYDQRNHGRSPGKKGHCDVGQLMIDGGQIAHRIRQDNPDLPLFLFGHSMGAIIATAVALKRPKLVDGVILTAAGFQPFPVLSIWMRTFVAQLGLFIPWCPVGKMKIEGVSHDKQVVKTLAADKMYHHGLVPMIAVGTMLVNGQKVLDKCRDFSVDALLFHGLDDPIADIQGARMFVAEAGLHLPVSQRPDVRLIEIEDCYHEVLNEYVCDEVMEQINDWLSKKTKSLCSSDRSSTRSTRDTSHKWMHTLPGYAHDSDEHRLRYDTTIAIR